jgi:hypothetical protein
MALMPSTAPVAENALHSTEHCASTHLRVYTRLPALLAGCSTTVGESVKTTLQKKKAEKSHALLQCDMM